MEFTEAVRLFQAIHERPLWHAMELSIKSGSMIEDDQWSVTAICTLKYTFIHYFAKPGDADAWPRYAESAEEGLRKRASSHDTAR